MSGRVRCAVVGCGVIGAVHAGLLSTMPSAELVTCCDIVPERAAAFAREYKASRWTTDYAEVLADPDIQSVTICTPHYLHAPMVIQAARAGKHVLVEKPLAMDPASASEAVKECRRRGLKLCVCLQNRMNTASVQVKRALEMGLLGRVLMVAGQVLWYRGEDYYTGSPWRGRWATEGGGVLINQAIHTLDLLSFFGGTVRSVCARTATLGHTSIEVEDVASAVIEYESGSLGSLVATTCAFPGSDVRIDIVGSKGSATIVGQELVHYETVDGGKEPPEIKARNGHVIPGKDYYGSSHGLVLEDYIAAIQEDRDPQITGEDGQVSVEILAAIYASAKSLRQELVTNGRQPAGPMPG